MIKLEKLLNEKSNGISKTDLEIEQKLVDIGKMVSVVCEKLMGDVANKILEINKLRLKEIPSTSGVKKLAPDFYTKKELEKGETPKKKHRRYR
jgi:hypothetical protein